MVGSIISMMDRKTPEAIAIKVGRDVGTVRAVLRAGRQAFARHAADYVELHWRGAAVAASKGDARPAQWALERIKADSERVVEPATEPHADCQTLTAGVTQPTFTQSFTAVALRESCRSPTPFSCRRCSLATAASPCRH
jgi:hypothetical protein